MHRSARKDELKRSKLPKSRRHRAGLVATLAVLFVGAFIASVPIDGRYAPIRNYRHAVAQPRLKSIRLLYSWIDQLSWQSGDDETVIGKLQGCGSGSCVPRGVAVIKDCAVTSSACVAPWTPAPAMGGSLLGAPVNDYPSKYISLIKTLLAAPTTACTSRTDNPGGYYTIQTICIGADGTVLYRRYGPTY